MVRIANLTEFQKNWSLSVVMPGILPCTLRAGAAPSKGDFTVAPLPRTKYTFDDGSKDTREVLIIQLSFSCLQCHIAQIIPSKKINDKKCKRLSFYKLLPKSY